MAGKNRAVDQSPEEGTDGIPPEQQDETVFKDPAHGRGIVPPYMGPADGASPEDYDEIEDNR